MVNVLEDHGMIWAKIFAGVRGGSSPPAGFGAAPQGFVFE
ncbi:MAG: hypothetical protein HW380_1059, partial [Magnetococcales bacterium]|nr:hypothetical protein [Magnetococcales bacterium]